MGEKYQTERGKWVSFDGRRVGWSGGGELMHWGVTKGLAKGGRGDKRGLRWLGGGFQVAGGATAVCDATKSVLMGEQ